jgi:hypothetical protein
MSHCAADAYKLVPTCPDFASNITFYPTVVKNKIIFVMLAFYEFLCIINVYSIGITKSENIQYSKIQISVAQRYN